MDRVSIRHLYNPPTIPQTSDADYSFYKHDSPGNKSYSQIPIKKSSSVMTHPDKVTLYRNEGEREAMMTEISNQQANYQRLLSK